MSSDDILIFRTSITEGQDIERIGVLFAQHPCIHKWSVDFEDREKVLRIESQGISVTEVIGVLRTLNIIASELE